MKIGKKIAFGLILITAVSLVTTSFTIGSVAINDGKTTLEQQAQDKLIALREMKKSQIEEYFSFIRKQILTYSEDDMIVHAMDTFKKAFHKIPGEVGNLDAARMRQSVADYYRTQFNQEFVRQNRTDSVELNSWLDQLQGAGLYLQTKYIAENTHPLGSKNALKNAADGTEYSQLHDHFHPLINDYLEKFDYYDIFLVDADTGHVIYSVFKELDFATSLLDGPFAQSGIGEVFQRARNLKSHSAAVISDFKPYSPSYMNPASFIASPVFKGDEVNGVLIFQMPVKHINDIMTSDGRWQDVGLGKTGETFLVGEDYKMRSINRGLLDNSAQFFSNLTEAGVNSATVESIELKKTTTGLLAVGQESVQNLASSQPGISNLINYQNRQVFSTYTGLDIEGLDWSIVSQIEVDEALEPAYLLADKIVYFSLLTTGIFVVLSALVGVIFARKLSRPIQSNVALANHIAEGELFHAIESRKSADELGQLQQAFGSMTEKLRGIVTNVYSSAASVKLSASEIASGNADLARRTEQQASSLENTASTINELTATAKQNAENAGHASELAASMQGYATDGKETVAKVVQAMLVIKESSSKISDIVTVVEEIAFQTNLLALNAAVEAARAGEQGKGFAVVASEVRNLAQRSTAAVGQIEQLVQEAVERVSVGEVLVSESGDSLEKIIGSVEQVQEIVQAIYDANEEQAISIDEVNRAIQQIDGITQQNAAMVEEAAVASQTLRKQAADLTANVEYFKVQRDGQGNAVANRAA